MTERSPAPGQSEESGDQAGAGGWAPVGWTAGAPPSRDVGSDYICPSKRTQSLSAMGRSDGAGDGAYVSDKWILQ